MRYRDSGMYELADRYETVAFCWLSGASWLPGPWQKQDAVGRGGSPSLPPHFTPSSSTFICFLPRRVHLSKESIHLKNKGKPLACDSLGHRELENVCEAVRSAEVLSEELNVAFTRKLGNNGQRS